MTIERALGRALTVLRDGKLHEPLGFARLTDYLRECLGLSMRSAQEMIRTEECLGELPRIAEAWERGQLGSEQVRLLTRVATNETEEYWVETARGLSVRQLSARIRRGQTTAPTSDRDDEQPDGTVSQVPENVDPSIAVSFLAPVPVASRWRATLRLCAAVSGEELPDWALVENLCAEFLSGMPLPPPEAPSTEADSAPPDVAGDSPWRTDGERSSASKPSTTRSQLASTHLISDGNSGRHGTLGRSAHRGFRLYAVDSNVSSFNSRMNLRPGRALDSQGSDPDDDHDADRRRRIGLPWVPRSLMEFLRLEAPSDPWQLHLRLTRLASMRTRLDSQLSSRLFEVVLKGTHRHAGYANFRDYARDVLGIGDRRARYLISLERKLLARPFVRAEYRRGRLSWIQCLILARIVRGPAQEAAWVSYARQVTVQRLREASQDAEIEVGSGGPGMPPRIIDETVQSGWQTSAPSGEPGETRNPGAARIRISFNAPAPVAQLWRATLVEVNRVAGRPLHDWEAVDMMFDAFLATWDDEHHRRIRREHKVLDRDGWRCSVPGCSSRRNLHVHHVRFRSAGGGHEQTNLTSLCASHHLRGIHGASGPHLIVRGTAPHGLRWTLGARVDGTPVMRFSGERCVFRLSDTPSARVGPGRMRGMR